MVIRGIGIREAGWYRECSARVVTLNRVVRKGLMDKVTGEKRSEGSETLCHVDIHEKSDPGREDPEVEGV